ncbi:protein dispatched homolog 1-like [Amphiura filiformis]|uniref:protein dispatched homolog 1-like n=1 Tax=Amphiura filiformis TaxID=82378 RepID=UPI003B20FEDC
MDESGTPSAQKSKEASGITYWYAKVLATFSPIVCVGVLVFVTVCSVISFTLFPLPDFSEPTQGFEARGTYISERIAMRTYLFMFLSFLFFSPPPDASKGRLVFGSKQKSGLFTTGSIKAMCEAEEKLFRDHYIFPYSCLPCGTTSCPDSWSLGTYVALLNNKTSCVDIDDDDVDNTKTLLAICASFYLNGSLKQRCSTLPPGTCTGVPPECINHDAVYIILHFLSKASFAQDLVANGNDAILKLAVIFLPMSSTDLASLLIYRDNIHDKTYRDSNVELRGLYFDIKFELFGSFMLGDTIYFGVGIALVIFLIWVYTGSLLVMFAAILNIVMSLLLGYFVYTVIFQRNFFPFVNVATVILIIGISADDTVVYMDLWKKSLADNAGEDLIWIVKDAIYHATATMFATSITTACALYTSMLSDITAVKGFALFSGTTILANFILTLTWLPAIIITQHKVMIWCCGPDVNSETNKLVKVRRLVSTVFAPFRYLIYELLPIVVVKLRLVWVALLGCLGIGFIFVVFLKPGLQLPSAAEFQLLRPSNLFEQYDLIYKNKFSFEGDMKTPMTGIIVLGTKPVDTGDPWNPKERGKIVLDESFSVYEPSSQVWLLNFCLDLRNQTFTIENERFFCFFDLFVQLMSLPCIHPLTGVDSTPCCQITPFPYPQPIMELCLKIVASQICATYKCDKTFPGPRFSTEDDRVAAHYMVFQSTYDLSFDYATMLQYWKTVNSWVESKLKTAPSSLQTGWFASFTYPQLYFFDLQQSLAYGIPVALGVTFAVAIAILILTILNFAVALLAIISIAFTVFTTIGSLILLGWQLNIFESVIITLSVGLSVDFTIHYAVAYNLAQHQSRIEKTRVALRTLSGALSIAALSTFIAGALMLLANVYVYVQLGTFLVLVMSISWVYSTFFFLSLCALIGPQGNVGRIPLPCLGGLSRGRVSDGGVADPVGHSGQGVR